MLRNILRKSLRMSAALSFMLTAFLLSGCGRMSAVAVQAGLMESPYYHLGDEEWDNGGVEEYWFNQIPSEMNELYRELYSRISNGEDQADIYAGMPTETFWKVYYALLSDHPEFFWIGSDIQVLESSLSGNVVGYQLSSTVPPENREEMRRQLEAAADECISQIPEGAGDYEKIKAVYEYLIRTVDYDIDSPFNQNIQSALLYKCSVCAGYARAFQYILHRMGMFCTYVSGVASDGSDHAWNIVRIGDQYYNVDVTWGDPVFAGEQDGAWNTAMNYNYLCCTDSELSLTHTPREDFALPSCTDESLNYYRLNGMYHEGFDYDEIYQVLMDSVWNGQDRVIMKFGSREAYEQAYRELFENDMLHDAAHYLMQQAGVNSWNYRYSNDKDFRLITIYWRQTDSEY